MEPASNPYTAPENTIADQPLEPTARAVRLGRIVFASAAFITLGLPTLVFSLVESWHPEFPEQSLLPMLLRGVGIITGALAAAPWVGGRIGRCLQLRGFLRSLGWTLLWGSAWSTLAGGWLMLHVMVSCSIQGDPLPTLNDLGQALAFCHIVFGGLSLLLALLLAALLRRRKTSATGS